MTQHPDACSARSLSPMMEDDFEESCPFCTCDEQPTEEEEAFNVCSACGKPLE